MVQFVAVSRERHGGKKWRRPDGYSFAAKDALVPMVAAELFRVALSMPIVFVEQSGRHQLMAMLSFTPGRNMMVGPDGRWLGTHIPTWYRGYPFRLLSRDEGAREPVLCIDEDSKLVVDGVAAGEDFFDANGGPSPALKPIVDELVAIERNRQATRLAVSAVSETGVIKPWPITLKTAQAEKTIAGLHRIDEAALDALADDAFLKLRKAAALPLVYGQMLSVGQLRVLEYLAKLQAQLPHSHLPASALANLPETLDGLFGLGEDDTVKFK
jgi:SapC